MIMIERYQRPRMLNGSYTIPLGVAHVAGHWQKAWQGEEWDDEARQLVQMCDHNGDPWRATFNSERVRR